MTEEERIEFLRQLDEAEEQRAKKRGCVYVSPYSQEIKDYVERNKAKWDAEYQKDLKEVEGLGIEPGDLHFAEKFYAGKICLDTASEKSWLHTAKRCRKILKKAGKWTDEYEMQYRSYVGVHKNDV